MRGLPESRVAAGSPGSRWQGVGGTREPATPLRRGGGEGEVTRTRILRDRGLLTPSEETAPFTLETLRMRLGATSCLARKARKKKALPAARRRHMRRNTIDAERKSFCQQFADWSEVHIALINPHPRLVEGSIFSSELKVKQNSDCRQFKSKATL